MATHETLMGAAEVCTYLGIKRQWLQELAARSDFPKPLQTLNCGRIWDAAAIRDYARRTGRLAVSE
jgi:predicted DNA-binding transcriptional regulator AlpA